MLVALMDFVPFYVFHTGHKHYVTTRFQRTCNWAQGLIVTKTFRTNFFSADLNISATSINLVRRHNVSILYFTSNSFLRKNHIRFIKHGNTLTMGESVRYPKTLEQYLILNYVVCVWTMLITLLAINKQYGV